MYLWLLFFFQRPHLAMVTLSMQINQKEYLEYVQVCYPNLNIYLKVPYPPFISCITSVISTRYTFNLRIPFLILVDFDWLVARAISCEYMGEWIASTMMILLVTYPCKIIKWPLTNLQTKTLKPYFYSLSFCQNYFKVL
jgi:hypothetical protein